MPLSFTTHDKVYGKQHKHFDTKHTCHQRSPKTLVSQPQLCCPSHIPIEKLPKCLHQASRIPSHPSFGINPSHLRLDLFLQFLQSLLVTLLLRPQNTQSLLLIRLGNHVEMYLFPGYQLCCPRSPAESHIRKEFCWLTWSTTWWAIRPLFCRMLKSVAPEALAMLFATGCLCGPFVSFLFVGLVSSERG